MGGTCGILTMFLALCMPLFAEDQPAAKDPIAEVIDAARLQYHEEIERLRTELLQNLQDKEDAARKAGDVALVGRIKMEREAFSLSEELPSVVSPERYRRGMSKARLTLKSALQTGVKAYLVAKQDDLAEGLQAEIKDLQAALESARRKSKSDKEKPEPELQVVAEGLLQSKHGESVNRSEFKLYSNGRIDKPDSEHTWSRQGRILTLRWQHPDAPGGFWVNIVTLAADGQSFRGRNQIGSEITGSLAAPPKEPKKAD